MAEASTIVTLAAAGRKLHACNDVNGSEFKRPRVAYVRSEYVMRYDRIHQPVLSEMIDAAVTSATKQPSPKEAWSAILKQDDIIGLKFNQAAARELNISAQMADIVIKSLVDAGFKADNIVLIEAPAGLASQYQTQPARIGWQDKETDFRSGSDRLAKYLDQVSAVINIPFLKTHRIARMTCTLKNISHAVVMNPARFHDNHCSPYIADIFSLPQVRDKIKLHLVNCLKVIHVGGPSGAGIQIQDAGVVLAGTDPVAIDTVGLDLLNQARKQSNLPPIAQQSEELPYISAAVARQLGCPHFNQIDIDYQQA
jgi:hypothetical protein